MARGQHDVDPSLPSPSNRVRVVDRLLFGMKLFDMPFTTTDWASVPPTEHRGDSGVAHWRMLHFGDIRIRMVEYSPGYAANHWCSKGHIVLCVSGQLVTELDDGRQFTLTPGMSYQVADGAGAHRSATAVGARLFVID